MSITVSVFLNLAADEMLWNGIDDRQYGMHSQFSCGAVCHAALKNDKTSFLSYQVVCEYLKELGLDVDASIEFDEFPYGEDRQGARYLWLKFAALVAEEEEEEEEGR